MQAPGEPADSGSLHGLRQRRQVGDWTWGWEYHGDGAPNTLSLTHRRNGYRFDGVPPERADEQPFSRFAELIAAGLPLRAERELRHEWGDYVQRSSARAQNDRKTAIPRIIVEQLTGRDATAVEIAAVAKLCNRFDKTSGGKVFAVTDCEVRAALDSIAVPALF